MKAQTPTLLAVVLLGFMMLAGDSRAQQVPEEATCIADLISKIGIGREGKAMMPIVMRVWEQLRMRGVPKKSMQMMADMISELVCCRCFCCDHYSFISMFVCFSSYIFLLHSLTSIPCACFLYPPLQRLHFFIPLLFLPFYSSTNSSFLPSLLFLPLSFLTAYTFLPFLVLSLIFFYNLLLPSYPRFPSRFILLQTPYLFLSFFPLLLPLQPLHSCLSLFPFIFLLHNLSIRSSPCFPPFLYNLSLLSPREVCMLKESPGSYKS